MAKRKMQSRSQKTALPRKKSIRKRRVVPSAFKKAAQALTKHLKSWATLHKQVRLRATALGRRMKKKTQALTVLPGAKKANRAVTTPVRRRKSKHQTRAVSQKTLRSGKPKTVARHRKRKEKSHA